MGVFLLRKAMKADEERLGRPTDVPSYFIDILPLNSA
jgi:hypothetical protein